MERRKEVIEKEARKMVEEMVDRIGKASQVRKEIERAKLRKLETHFGESEYEKLENLCEETGTEVLGRRGNLIHIRSLKQPRGSGMCGYYSLYNLCISILALRCECERTSVRIFALLQNRPFFYLFVHHCFSILEQNVQEGGSYPWTIEEIRSGLLERIYVDYLLKKENWHYLVSKMFSIDIQPLTVLPEFSLEHIKNNCLSLRTVKTVKNLSKRIQESEDFTHGVLLGITCHWTALVVHKRGEHVHLAYFDSDNRQVVHLDSRQALEQHCQQFMSSEHFMQEEVKRQEAFIRLDERRQVIHLLLDALCKHDFHIEQAKKIFSDFSDHAQLLFFAGSMPDEHSKFSLHFLPHDFSGLQGRPPLRLLGAQLLAHSST